MKEKIRGSVKGSAEMACSILQVILSMKRTLMGIKVSARTDTPQKTDLIYSAEAGTTFNLYGFAHCWMANISSSLFLWN